MDVRSWDFLQSEVPHVSQIHVERTFFLRLQTLLRWQAQNSIGVPSFYFFVFIAFIIINCQLLKSRTILYH